MTTDAYLSTHQQALEENLVDVEALANAINGNIAWAKGALKSYAEEAPEHIRALKSAVESQDFTQLYQTAHTVKGVSRLFQIAAVADAAQTVERACQREECWSIVSQHVETLERLLCRAVEACEAIDD